MHTEEEAQAKWCPMMVDKPGGVRTIAKINMIGCVGVSCMAWRWGGDTWVEVGGGAGMHLQKAGYCGLAGKPGA